MIYANLLFFSQLSWTLCRMVSGEISTNAGDYAAALFTSHMKQERPKCQPHPIHKLSHGEKIHFIKIGKSEYV